MKDTLRPGLTHEHRFTVTESKTVPNVYPESELFRDMPRVFATAYMVGLVEWACMELLRPHLDAHERTVGVDVRLDHTAATPPGMTVTVKAALEKIEGKRLSFRVSAHDGVEPICEGTHERFVIDPERFGKRVAEKAARKP